MPNVVLLFPGQGSQAPGMGKDLASRFPAARDVFDAANAALTTIFGKITERGVKVSCAPLPETEPSAAQG